MSTWHAFTDEGHLVGDDDTGRVRVYDGEELVAERDFTQAEGQVRDARVAATARLDDLEARVSALEAVAWPPEPDPGPGQDVPTWQDRGGIWPHGTLLADGGRVWRNVAGVPLTTPPSAFPGGPWLWPLLFVETDPQDPDPDPDPPVVVAWAPGQDVAVGDERSHAGRVWRARIAHRTHIGWVPSAATHAVWEDISP